VASKQLTEYRQDRTECQHPERSFFAISTRFLRGPITPPEDGGSRVPFSTGSRPQLTGLLKQALRRPAPALLLSERLHFWKRLCGDDEDREKENAQQELREFRGCSISSGPLRSHAWNIGCHAVR